MANASQPDELAHILASLAVDPPAEDDELERLVSHVSREYGASVPEDYLAFLRTANGADGDLANGAHVVFWKAELLPQINEDAEIDQPLVGMFVIGNDAGDAFYGIDLREDAPPERYVETYDVMEWDDVLWRGSSFLDLLHHLGRPLALEKPESSRLGRLRRLLRGLR